MVEKVRLSVDKETSSLLQFVTERLGEQLSTQPPWAADLNKGIADYRGEIQAATQEILATISGIHTALENQTRAIETVQKSLADMLQASEAHHQYLVANLRRPWWRRLFGR